MIVNPSNWRNVGKEVQLYEISHAIRRAIYDTGCRTLSLSGGVDSCLLLAYMLEVWRGQAIYTYTAANSADHPDIVYSFKAIRYYERLLPVKITRNVYTIEGKSGDDFVREFYKELHGRGVGDIIAGDCIDELAAGYYQHQDLTESTYYELLRRLQANHLEPLNVNSGAVEVYLPFAVETVANLFYRIPLADKVSETSRKRVIMKLAEGRVPREIIGRRKYGLGTSVQRAGVA